MQILFRVASSRQLPCSYLVGLCFLPQNAIPFVSRWLIDVSASSHSQHSLSPSQLVCKRELLSFEIFPQYTGRHYPHVSPFGVLLRDIRSQLRRPEDSFFVAVSFRSRRSGQPIARGACELLVRCLTEYRRTSSGLCENLKSSNFYFTKFGSCDIEATMWMTAVI